MRRPRLSASSSEGIGARSARAALHLDFDEGYPYIAAGLDLRPLPRLPVYVARSPNDTAPVRLEPVVDTGAECTVFDGSLATALGWPDEDIAGRAEDVRPISGLSADARPLTGYAHRLQCLIPAGSRYAELTITVLLTAPNTLSTPVLGRRDFLRQVDMALVEAEQRFYLRFRDQSVLREAW